MEEYKPRNIFTTKTVRIMFLVTLTVTVILLLIYFALIIFNQNKIVAVPDQTGAVQSSLPATEKESYDELYNLMDQGEITLDYFKIKPIYQDRTIQITVKKPLDQNRDKAETWLKQNGYGNIPSSKILYFESMD
jgi:hypothetical protein